MANVTHASLTGSELHEPKGADAAALGTVYVSNGAGSGSWQSVGTSAFTGMVADFPAPVAPSGWLECDGSIISTTTYAGLFGVMSMTSSGAKNNGSPTITGISSTTGMKVGYYVFGTGIASGTTILTVDGPTQITMSGNSSATGTSAFFVSPFLMNTGTIKLPDLTTAGRFRRSRTSSTEVGQAQADQNKAHTHSVSGTTGSQSADHTHTYSGTTANNNVNHTHGFNAILTGNGPTGGGVGGGGSFGTTQGGVTGTESANHTHTYSGTTSGISVGHTHTFSATTGSDGGTETRPTAMVFLTCIKT